MKKLMTMIAAVATAFGLFAADPADDRGTSFEGATDGATLNASVGEILELPKPLAVTTDNYWNGLDTAGQTQLIKEYQATFANRPSQYDGESNDFCLELATGTSVLERYRKPNGGTTDILNGNLFFDSVVNMTAFEDAPTIPQDAKIAVWLQEKLNEETQDPVATNLMVTINGNDYACGDYSSILEQWARVTVKALKLGNGKIGFVVFVNGEMVKVDGEITPITYTDYANYNSNAKKYADEAALFPFDGADTTITAAGFAGKGSIDDLVFTETAPDFDYAADFAFCTIEGATGIKSFEVAGTTWNKDDDALEVEVVNGQVPVVNITADESYFVTQTSKTFTDVTDGDELTVDGAKALGATVKIDGQADQYFENAAAAIEHLNGLTSATTATLTLNAGSGAIEIDNEYLTLTLDLAGKTIEGETDEDVILVSEGVLTITNSTDTIGKVVANGTAKAVKAIAEEATLNITAGIFDGAAHLIDDATISITGGKFLAEKNEKDKLEEFIPAGSMLVEENGYFVLKTTVAVTFANGTNSTITPAAGVSNYVAGTKLTITATAAEGYKFGDLTDPWVKVDATTAKIEDYEVTATATITAPDAVAIDYVAQIGTDKYESLAEAVAAAQDIEGAVVEIIKNCNIDAQIAITKGNFTISNNCEVTCADITGSGDYSITINGATVTFTGNGTWTKVAGVGSMVQAGASAAASIIINAGTYIMGSSDPEALWTDDKTKINDGKAPSNGFTTKNGSIVVNAGTFTSYRTDEARCVRAEGTSTNTINGGVFTTALVKGKDNLANRVVPVDNKNVATAWVVIPADSKAEFHCFADNVKDIMNKFCADGYKLADKAEAGTYVVTAIEYVTLTLTKDENVTAVVVSNATEEVTLDDQGKAKFDKDDQVVVTAYPTFAENYELDTEKSSALTATMTADQTINIVSKSTAPAPTPIDPTNPEPFDNQGAAQARADQINADKTLITVPTGFAGNEDIYRGAVAAKAVAAAAGGFEVVIDIANESAVQTVVDADAVKAIADLSTPTAEIDAIPGLYYSVIAGETLGGMIEGERVPATSNKVTLTFPRGDNAGFYKIHVSATPAK